MKISLWLKDGSIYMDCTLASANIGIDGKPFGVTSLDKIDSAFLYTIGGGKIYRDHVSGTVQIAVDGVNGTMPVNVINIADLARANAP